MLEPEAFSLVVNRYYSRSQDRVFDSQPLVTIVCGDDGLPLDIWIVYEDGLPLDRH